MAGELLKARRWSVTDNREIMSAIEAAAYLRSHVETVRRLARRNQIPAFKVGKDWRFRRDILLKWVEMQQFASRPPLALVIDDDPGVRGFISKAIRRLGYRAVEANGGDEALLEMQRETPGLILLDLLMPGMNGIEVLIKVRDSYPKVPVAIITGNPGSSLISEAIQYGPFLILAKPVYEQQLKSVLHVSMGEPAGNPGGWKREVA
jgi:excisionase family DNA binding protein